MTKPSIIFPQGPGKTIRGICARKAFKKLAESIKSDFFRVGGGNGLNIYPSNVVVPSEPNGKWQYRVCSFMHNNVIRLEIAIHQRKVRQQTVAAAIEWSPQIGLIVRVEARKATGLDD